MPNKKNKNRRVHAAKKAARKPIRRVAKPKARTKVIARHKINASRKAAKLAPKIKAKMAPIKAAIPEPKKKTNPAIMPPDVVKREIDVLLSNEKATEYLKRNVSKTAIDVLCMLASPKTDEHLAEQLGMKINAIRRMLNIMQGYGITNYYVSKNTKGWLSFAWYINTTKLAPFLEFVNRTERENAVINSNCNDYFLCNECYKSDMLVYTFDAAFESNFKCNCGKNLARMDKAETETMLNAAKVI